MQVSSNVYVDIKVKGSNKEGIVSYDMLENFQLVETAGTSLPYICFSFATFDKDLADLFMENNQIVVTIGETKEQAETFTIYPFVNTKDTDASNNSWKVTLGGFIGNNSYMMNKAECKSYNGNSLMVVQQIIKEFPGLNPKVDTDIEKTNENQVTWRQTYDVTSTFMVDTLLHMDIQPSFPLFTFDKYGTFHVRDFNKLRAKDPQWIFTPIEPKQTNELQYLNNFNAENFKAAYNLYSGYNKMTEVYGVAGGIPSYVVDDNTPILSSAKESEKMPSGNRVSLNKIQSDNVHKTYMEAYAYNTNNLMSLSSMLGCLEIKGYHPALKPTDLVYVRSDKTGGSDSTLEGYYLIDTIVVCPMFQNGAVTTLVYVSRDNKNNVENFIAEKKKKNLLLTKKDVQQVANAVARTRVALAKCSQIMDGTFTKSCLSFLIAAKNNILRMFSIGGTMLDFTSRARFLQSLLCCCNTLMNALLNMLFPDFIANIFRDFLINKPSLRALLAQYIDEYVPIELQDIISELVDSLLVVHSSLNSIAKANGITAREIPEVAEVDSSFQEVENRVGEIIEEFENNTTGLDVPFPIIELTESQELLPTNELREYVADETIANLTNLGYMEDVDPELFKEILLGETPIDFQVIKQINENAGYSLGYRYWGTYGPTNEALFAWQVGDNIVYTKSDKVTVYTRLYENDYSPYTGNNFSVVEENENEYAIVYTDITGTIKAERNEEEDVNSTALAQLTNYYITKGYKDLYRTIPCTKLISATKNARLYFACPQTEENLKFYINSKRVELKSFVIDLGYRDMYGTPILYNVYYTETGYNSNSTMLEVRQG